MGQGSGATDMANYHTNKHKRLFKLSKQLTKEMIEAFPKAFKTSEDVSNSLNHRLAGIATIQHINGEEIGSDFLLAEDESIITGIFFFTGYVRKDGGMLVIEFTAQGSYISHAWDYVSTDNSLSALMEATLPLFDKVSISYGHVTSRLNRRGQNRYSSPDQIRAMLEHIRDTDQLISRTIHNSQVTYLIPLPFANAVAAAKYDANTATIHVATILSPDMAVRANYSHKPSSVNS